MTVPSCKRRHVLHDLVSKPGFDIIPETEHYRQLGSKSFSGKAYYLGHTESHHNTSVDSTGHRSMMKSIPIKATLRLDYVDVFIRWYRDVIFISLDDNLKNNEILCDEIFEKHAAHTSSAIVHIDSDKGKTFVAELKHGRVPELVTQQILLPLYKRRMHIPPVALHVEDLRTSNGGRIVGDMR